MAGLNALKAETSGQEDGRNDAELIREVAKGDKAAFRILAGRYQGKLYAAAYRMTGNVSDAEDIVQEALLRLWSKASSWSEDGGASVSTWLYRILTNLSIDLKRKAHRREVEMKVEVEDEAQGAEKDMLDNQVGVAVSAALETLPERQRTALVLCHFEGMSNAEAADAMDTSVKGVEGLLVRARQGLKDKLKSQYQQFL